MTYNFNEKDSKDSYDDSYKHYNFNSTFSYIYIIRAFQVQ